MTSLRDLGFMIGAPDGAITETVNRNLLRHSAGRAIWCPGEGCGRCMDWRRTVVISFHDGDECVTCVTLCDRCADAWLPATIDKFTARAMLRWPTVEVVDGRTYTKAGRLRARPPITSAIQVATEHNAKVAQHNDLVNRQGSLL